MKPIKITLITLGSWVMLTIVYAFNFVEDVSEKPFEVALYSFYLTPFVCIIGFATSLFFYPSWIRENKILFACFSLILVSCSLYIIVYIKLLFLERLFSLI